MDNWIANDVNSMITYVDSDGCLRIDIWHGGARIGSPFINGVAIFSEKPIIEIYAYVDEHPEQISQMLGFKASDKPPDHPNHIFAEPLDPDDDMY